MIFFLNSAYSQVARKWAHLSIGMVVAAAWLSASSCGGGSSSNGPPPPPSAKEALYLSSGASAGQVIAFVFDTATETVGSPMFIAGPAAGIDIKVYPGGTFLYLSDFNTSSVYAYSINRSSGALTPVSGSPFNHPSLGEHGGPIAIDPGGKYLFSSDASGTIVSFTIDSQTGVIKPNAARSVNDSHLPVYLLVDSTGRFLIASNHADSAGQNFSVFSIDPSTGVLIEIPGSPFTFGVDTQPKQILLNSGNSVLYAALSNSQQVNAIDFDSGTGKLTAIQGAPYPAGAMPTSIALAPSGAFLYAANTGADTVSEYGVDASTGALTPGNAVHAGNASFLDFDSSGRFLLIVGEDSGTLSVFKVDLTTGTLSPGNITNLPAGANVSAASFLVPLQ